MSARDCCEVRAVGGGPRARGVLGCVLPGAILVLMPKCPMCVAAYIALVTGVGVSVSLAAGLRVFVMVLCGVALGWFAVRAFWRRGLV